ncbi:unnamed protein product [Effrenium voratum]|uniref:Thioesterase domain-containing protein n=1 Tax=Effrenium voratum TaxID=2562239 RepID=A0AA36NHI9_9DINO|nr:unnamed protein product [Effrenium voratum]CAJ1435642.1 unnamed protein product [Effrenium voratum]
MWEVTGGSDKGGILVREGQALSSKACDDRLSTGAKVKELQLASDRLRYELVSGTGPKTGWVSTKISGKELLKRADGTATSAPTSPEVAVPDFEQLDAPVIKGGTAATGKTPWLKMLGKANPGAKGRLVIFSWTGNRGGQGSAHNFARAPGRWSELLKDLEQYEVAYPGRGTRLKDPLYEDCNAYVKDMTAALQEALKDGKPVVFLGFSFGAVLATEVARRLPWPVAAAVLCSAEAPQWPGRANLGLAQLSPERFEQMLHDKGGTDFILKDPGMKKMFVPVINADCKLEENYRFDPSLGPLKCPVHVFFGTKEGHDKMKTLIKPEDAEGWLKISACQKLSKVQAVDCDWYLFQDPSGCDPVAERLAELTAGF